LIVVVKKTLSFDEELWVAVERRAREAETTPSAYINQLVANGERRYRGLEAVADWESVHGVLSGDQLDWADRALVESRLEAANDTSSQRT
jgi:hypothetical protein